MFYKHRLCITFEQFTKCYLAPQTAGQGQLLLAFLIFLSLLLSYKTSSDTDLSKDDNTKTAFKKKKKKTCNGMRVVFNKVTTSGTKMGPVLAEHTNLSEKALETTEKLYLKMWQ